MMLTLVDLKVVLVIMKRKLGHWDVGFGKLQGMCMFFRLILILVGRVLHRGSSGGFVHYPRGWISK